MGNNENAIDRLQEKLAALENGQTLENCLKDLPAEESGLLELASALRSFAPSSRRNEVVLTQLARVTRAAEEQQASRRVRATTPLRPARPAWLLPLIAAGGAALILVACLGFGIGAGRIALGVLDQISLARASANEVRGLVEQQEPDGSWAVVDRKSQFKAGDRLRTGKLSALQLNLWDSSQLWLGPETEIVLEQMDRSPRGTRIIRITHWQGETRHLVQPATRAGSRYEVRTPAGTAAARGTDFTIQVDAGQHTRVLVAQGTVEVTGLGSQVFVPAGQATTLTTTQPPAAPAFLAHGDGVLAVSEDIVTIAGQPAVLGPRTRLVGNPQPGDLVAFEGQELQDGVLQIDRLEYLTTPGIGPFQLTGPVEAVADNALVAAGAVIQVDAKTALSGAVDPGKDVTIEGVIQADQTWLATRVYSSETGQPFQFSGIVQQMETGQWTISAIDVAVDNNTHIAPGIAPGDVVEVQVWIQADGTWLAGSIQPASSGETYFDISGTVEDTDPWIVHGILLETRAWTWIEAGIEIGDQVHARGVILADGAWVAAAIDKTGETTEELVTLEFVGTVNSTDPWVVSGIPLVVDSATVIEGLVETGALVEVRATRLPDGDWHADRITAVAPISYGCATYAALVEAIDGSILTLQDGSTIDLSQVERVEGEIQVQSVILVVKCLAADGTVTYPLVKVLKSPGDEPTPTPTHTFTPTATNTPLPDSIILPNCYKITFLGMVDHGDGTSSWRYLVEELACAQDLSNWVLELPGCAQIHSASPSPWEAVAPDPNNQLDGIKWETGTGFEQGEFTVTLSGELTIGLTQVGAKGPDVAVGNIAGPVCGPDELTPSPTPTVTLTPTLTLTPTATVEVVPTLTQTLTNPLPPVSSPIVITENNQTLTINCSGAAVIVNGNSNTLTLLGTCSSLMVRGNNNYITVSAGTPITNTGNANVIVQQ